MPKLRNTEIYILLEMDERVTTNYSNIFEMSPNINEVFLFKLGKRRVSSAQNDQG